MTQGEAQDAVTRNSNLQFIPKNDKLNKQIQNHSGYSNSYSHQGQNMKEDPKNSISIEQLK